jgi:hypothetical protein
LRVGIKKRITFSGPGHSCIISPTFTIKQYY